MNLLAYRRLDESQITIGDLLDKGTIYVKSDREYYIFIDMIKANFNAMKFF